MSSSLKSYNVKLQVQDYFIGDKIGSGSFGQIRIAFHNKSKNPFAVKVLSKVKLQNSKHGNHIIFNETLLAPLLTHSSIMEIVEIADSHSQIFQFMRFADQGDLRHVLRKSILQHSIILRIVDQLLSAVEYLHSYGIVHRDIKLENIMFSRHTGIKLSDFGLASITFDGKVHGNFGTFEYSAPEAIKSTEFDGFKADMWSVGVVIYALFSRKLPFLNVDKDYKFEEQTVDYSHIPTMILPLVLQLLSIDPNQRPSATEARGFAGLNSSQTKKKEPLSALVDLVNDSSKTFIIASKLSQVLRTPMEQLLTKFQAPTYSKEKLLFLLWQNKIEARNLTALNSPFKINISAHTMPPKLSDKTIMCQVFPVSASTLFEKLHQYLMKERCCVSSPLSDIAVIDQKKEGIDTDVKIKYNCYDKANNDPQSMLTLDSRDDPIYGAKLSLDIMNFMKSSFVK